MLLIVIQLRENIVTCQPNSLKEDQNSLISQFLTQSLPFSIMDIHQTVLVDDIVFK